MSSVERQNKLFAAESWDKVYQGFRVADFQSYDFSNIRRVMINYLQENYPEDFNDYIESSEYLALIDMIAFLGQGISYRADLNSQNNLLDVADRKETVIRLARQLSYTPKRNNTSSGLLKIVNITTTEKILDSNGRDLSNQTILWNDATSSAWQEHFTRIINSSLNTAKIGRPEFSGAVNGIHTEKYSIRGVQNQIPAYSFSSTINGRQMIFEAVSADITSDSQIIEASPANSTPFSILYRNDNRGNSSANTGYFVMFKQGQLNSGDFVINNPSTSEFIDINVSNINETDIWLYKINQSGAETTLWEKVPSLVGNNVIYNSLNKNIRNIYGIIPQVDDKVRLLFSDGLFGDLPIGSFRVYYRVSNGLSYTIVPLDLKNVVVTIPYTSANGRIETLTMTLDLMLSVNNSSEAETISDIRKNAPATYFTQNRVVTGEDYNLGALSVNQEVLKVSAINRTSAGISKFNELKQSTDVILNANDGILYAEDDTEHVTFSAISKIEIEKILRSTVFPKINKSSFRDFYYNTVPRTEIDGIKWNLNFNDSNVSSGYLSSLSTTIPAMVGINATTQLTVVRVGALLKFSAPTGYYFDTTDQNNLVLSNAEPHTIAGAATEVWTKVVKLVNDGLYNSEDDSPIWLSDNIPGGSELISVIPSWNTTISESLLTTIISLIFERKTFALSFDLDKNSWVVINGEDILYGSFTFLNNNSWLILFSNDLKTYTVRFRSLRFIFESKDQLRFYANSSDLINVLNINTLPGQTIPFSTDKIWKVDDSAVLPSGYIDDKKIYVTPCDSDADGVVDNPDLFDVIVGPLSYIVQQKYVTSTGHESYKFFDNSENTVKIVNTQSEIYFTEYQVGQYFYILETKELKKYVGVPNRTTDSNDYLVFEGRHNIKFQYVHYVDSDSRVDPNITNIIDIYVLTKLYDQQYRLWANGTLLVEPKPMNTEELTSMMRPTLYSKKPISDEMIFHPVKYKLLFGSKARPEFRAVFTVVKSPMSQLNDNEIKSRILSSIDLFFSVDSWDFGDHFYFTELSTFILNRMSPNIVNFSIVPYSNTSNLGSMYEIVSDPSEIFLSCATVDDIEILSSLSPTTIKLN